MLLFSENYPELWIGHGLKITLLCSVDFPRFEASESAAVASSSGQTLNQSPSSKLSAHVSNLPVARAWADAGDGVSRVIRFPGKRFSTLGGRSLVNVLINTLVYSLQSYGDVHRILVFHISQQRECAVRWEKKPPHTPGTFQYPGHDGGCTYRPQMGAKD